MKYNITEEQLKQIIIEELEAYLLEEGIMDFGKRIGRKAKGAAAGLAMMGALSGAPADVAAKPTQSITKNVKLYKGDLKTDFKTGKVTYVSYDGKTADVTSAKAKDGEFKDYVKKYGSFKRGKEKFQRDLKDARLKMGYDLTR
tara:strand:- start:68 stop:496 length:429 start_codon:yes stop_codon:yes gene_type:complete